MNLKLFYDFFWRHFRKLAAGSVALVIALFLFHRMVPEVLPQILRFDFYQSLVITLFLLAFDRLLIVEQTVRGEIIGRSLFLYHPTREAAHAHVCEWLRSRGTEVRQIDLLQFSGDTAISILQEAAKNCPTATIRLLLINYDYAEKFDEPDFHRTRIRHTLGVIKILKESRPELKISVWSYQSEPGIAGVLMDNWLVSAGWYHTFPDEKSPTGLSIRGHRDPAINAIEGAAPELFSLVRKQFDAVLGTAKAETA